MKQEISALMDGEMFEDQADAFLDKLKRHPEGTARLGKLSSDRRCLATT